MLNPISRIHSRSWPLLVLALFGSFGLLVGPGPVRGQPATPMSSPDEQDRGGTVVDSVRELRFYDANGDSHVFEIEELPAEAANGRGGALQISPVATGTYGTDTDYLLIQPLTGTIVLGGKGSVDLRGSTLEGIDELRFGDRNQDGRFFRIQELGANAGPFSGMLRLRVGRGTNWRDTDLLLVNPDEGWVGFPTDVGIRGKLGVRGVPVTLGEPLEANGQPIRGLPEQPCGTCAVRADYFDADASGRVDVAETVEDLRGAAGCETGQWCTDVKQFEVPAGESRRITFEHRFQQALPQLLETPTFRPGDSSDRVPAITIKSVLRGNEGNVTGVILRNGDAEAAHSGSVAVQGIVR